ncbi:hypothetical protein IFM89_028199 [Coptis chinensis]|uniref:Uncharacterized protein n=1 Tax=Coptis chinensis TaxID=261450 RepID=A0A835HHR6_9MAGN|nr:hypothetical protein IFM89_028199 [Coptis chinensis]
MNLYEFENSTNAGIVTSSEEKTTTWCLPIQATSGSKLGDNIMTFEDKVKANATSLVGRMDFQKIKLDVVQAIAAEKWPPKQSWKIVPLGKILREVPNQILVEDPNGVDFLQEIESSKLPKFCGHCKSIGYLMSECKSLQKEMRSEKDPRPNKEKRPKNQNNTEATTWKKKRSINRKNKNNEFGGPISCPS